MPETSCIVCKCLKSEETKQFFRIPRDITVRALWLKSLNLEEAAIKDHHRVCSLHFPNGDKTQPPSLTLGPSPKKVYSKRSKRQKRRSLFLSPPPAPKRQLIATTCAPDHDNSDNQEDSGSRACSPMSAHAGEQLLSSSDYSDSP